MSAVEASLTDIGECDGGRIGIVSSVKVREEVHLFAYLYYPAVDWLFVAADHGGLPPSTEWVVGWCRFCCVCPSP